MTTEDPQPPSMGRNYSSGSRSLLANISKQLNLLPGFQGLGQDITKLDQQTQTPGSTTPLEKIKHEAEVIAGDVICSFGLENEAKKPVDRYCKTMRRTIRELSDRHDFVFKGMVNKLNVNDTNAFSTFVRVADEIFEDGQINWGRVVVVYTFAARLAVHCLPSNPECDERISLYAGKYVSSKLGRWILDNGGWDAFADYFPEQAAVEDRLWKGLINTALGFGALINLVSNH